MMYADYLTGLYVPCKLFGRKYKSNLSLLAVLNTIKLLTERGKTTTFSNIRAVTCNTNDHLHKILSILTERAYINTTQGKGLYYHLTAAGELHLKQFDETVRLRVEKICRLTSINIERFGA